MSERELDELSAQECLALLKRHTVGRIAVVEDGFPRIVPVNYRVTATDAGPWIGLRTRRHGLVDHLGASVCFEVDELDETKREGWSVLVCGPLEGLMIDSEPLVEAFETDPWITRGRNCWLVIAPVTVTGRSLHARRRTRNGVRPPR